MLPLAPRADLPPSRVRLARLLALTADFVQIIAFPLFAQGALSPITDVLDVVVGLAFCLLLGWHWAFVPTFLVEMVPLFNLFPTWTTAVFYVTSGPSEPSPHAPPPPRDITPGPGGPPAPPAEPPPPRSV